MAYPLLHANVVVSGYFLCIFAILLEVVGAAHVFDVYRAIQFDKSGVQYGSRKSYLGAAAAAFDTAAAERGEIGGVPVRQALVVRLSELTLSTVETLLSSTSVGILILLPAQLSEPGFVNEATLDIMRTLENRILHSAFDIPIYFAVEDEKLDETYASLKRRMQSRISTADDYSIVVSEKEAEAVGKQNVATFQGELFGNNDDSSHAIAIVAHYDTLGSVPGFTKGTDHNGSGTTALFELARLFSKLYSSVQTKAGYNMYFILSGGGRMNYFGTRQWLQNAPHPLLDSLDFALCLESIGKENLYLHVSKKPKDDNIKNLYNQFATTAAEMGIPFEIIHKKINVSHSEMAWEHEAFAYKKVIAATLSDNKAPTPQFTRSSALDSHVSQEVIERNIELISTVLCNYMYQNEGGRKKGNSDQSLASKNVTIFKGALGINSRFISTWLNYFSKTPRPTPYLQPTNTIFPTFSKVLSTYLVDVQEKKYDLKGEYKFYGNTVAKMHIHTTKPLLFDLLLLIPIALYLLALNMYFKGWETVNEFLGQLGLHVPGTPPVAASSPRSGRR